MRKIFLEVPSLLLSLSNHLPSEELQEADIADPDEPSSPDLPKKTRPARACDWCRKKKVRPSISPDQSLIS